MVDPITHMRNVLDRRGYPEGITEDQMVEVPLSLPSGIDVGVPDYANDRNDMYMKVQLLRPEDREALGLPLLRPVERPAELFR